MKDNYEIKNPEVEARLHELGQYLKGKMPSGMAFTLLMSDIGEGGAMFYISSVERQSALESMKEFLIKQKYLPADGAVPSLTAADLGITPQPVNPMFDGLSPKVQEIHNAAMVFIRMCIETNAKSGRFAVEKLVVGKKEVGNWVVSVQKVA